MEHKLELDIKQIWICKCGHRQVGIEGEEWPFHCDKAMSIGHTWQIIPAQDQDLKRIEAYLQAKQRKHDCPGFDCAICTVSKAELKEASESDMWD